MKRIFTLLLAFLAFVSVSHGAPSYVPLLVNRTNSILPTGTRFLQANAQVFDQDADSYAMDVGCVDVDERLKLSIFIQGLKDLGLWCNAKLLLSLRTNHQVSSGSSIIAIKGNLCTLVGSPDRNAYGYTLDGTGNQYLTFTNPFTGTLTNISLVAAFDCDNSAANGAVMSGYNNSPNKSFGVYANGGPGAGNIPGFSEMTLSADGSASFTQSAGRYAGDYMTTGNPQTLFAGFSAKEFALQSDEGVRRTTSTNGSFGTIFNPNTTWQIGRSVGGGTPFFGTISFIGIWDRYLSEYEYLAIRRLYSITIGRDFVPAVNLIVEGDSITAGGGTNTGVKLWHQSMLDPLAGYFPSPARRNASTGGETASTMLSTLNQQCLHYSLANRFYGRGYLMINGGLNDLLTTDSTNTFNTLKAAWLRARAVGLRVVAFTITPSANYTAPQSAQRLLLNDMIRGASNSWDYLVDLGKVANLTNTANATYFQGDGVHLQQAGQDEILNAVKAAIPQP